MRAHMVNHLWTRLCRTLAGLSAEARGLSIVGGAIALTLIAAGGDALRGPAQTARIPAAAPFAADRLSVTMAAPPAGDVGAAAARGPFGPEHTGPDTAVPHLASLAPPEGAGADVSRVARIFRGPPPAVPPERPAPRPRDARGQGERAVAGPLAAAPRPRARPDPAAQPRQSAALRPRLRPDALATAPGTGRAGPSAAPETRDAGAPERQQAVLRPRARPANLSVASDRATTGGARRAAAPTAAPPADPPRQQAAPSAAPRIVRASERCPARLSREMPRRARNAAGASAVMARLRAVDGVVRDGHVVREMLGGNMPGFLRNLRPVSIRGRAADGATVRITLCVTPDYIALGSDADHVRVPLGLRAATRLGDAFDMLLPTPRMVDLIHRAADVRLLPRPMPAGPQMRSTGYLLRHNATVEAQRHRAGAAPGALISGHKKDVVLTTRLATRPGRVAIYGWHRGNGQPIQPLSTVHGAGYADYSHGVRLVSRTAYLDGKPVDLRSLIAAPRYAGLLSDEGPVTGPRLRMAALAAN